MLASKSSHAFPLSFGHRLAKNVRVFPHHRLSFQSFATVVKMDDLVALCKKKGFVFPSSDIYNSLSGFFDYGPLGVELKNNIKKIWWRDMVQRRDDVVGLDSSIIGSPLMWKASGHVDGFSDPMVDCRSSNTRFRADQVFWAAVETTATTTSESNVIGYVTVLESENMVDIATKAANKIAKQLVSTSGKPPAIKPLLLQELTDIPSDILLLLPSPINGVIGSLTPPRDFNLMFQTNVGALANESTTAYLRPETAQGIFVNFAHVQRSARLKIPFGIAQVGKAFRNEITPRNFVFRSREFEQMEIEYFIPPDEDCWQQHHQDWVDTCWNWLLMLGIKEDLLSKQVHNNNKLAHYARACTDIVFEFPFGKQELLGIAARGDYDLQQHQQASGKNLEYLDVANNNRKYLPHVIEPSIGVDRLFLALLASAYEQEVVTNNTNNNSSSETRVVLRLHPMLAPIKVSVFPLVSNNNELMLLSQQVNKQLQQHFMTELDSSGSIGRRYRRSDEIGVPWCVTVDFESLNNNKVTVRDRDSMKQVQCNIDELSDYIQQQLNNSEKKTTTGARAMTAV